MKCESLSTAAAAAAAKRATLLEEVVKGCARERKRRIVS